MLACPASSTRTGGSSPHLAVVTHWLREVCPSRQRGANRPELLVPDGASWVQLYGVSACAGIGFTMSLFIGTLAFAGAGLEPMVRLGVLVASVLSAAVGYTVLRFVPPFSKNL